YVKIFLHNSKLVYLVELKSYQISYNLINTKGIKLWSITDQQDFSESAARLILKAAIFPVLLPEHRMIKWASAANISHSKNAKMMNPLRKTNIWIKALCCALPSIRLQ